MGASIRRLRSVVATLLLVAGLASRSFGADAGSPDLRLPPDVTYKFSETSPGAVVFSHATHVPLNDNRCVTCHPAPFSILRPAGRMTHEEMNAGQKCGLCHDGAKASGVQDSCDHCHHAGGGP